MEFKVHVTLDVSPALLSVLTAIGMVADKPIFAETAKPAENAPKKGKGAKAETATAEGTTDILGAKVPTHEEEPAPPKSKAAKVYTLEEVQTVCREAIDADENNRSAIKTLLADEFEAPELRKLEQEKYPEFVKKVKALIL